MQKLFLYVIAFCLIAASARADALDDFAKAMAAGKAGDHQLAIENYTKAINSGELTEDKLAITFTHRGAIYYKLGQHALAIEDHDQAIRLDPKFALAYHNRAIAYHQLEQIERAIEDYDRAIGLDPKIPSAYMNRGSAFHYLGQYDRAIEDYSVVIQLNPDYVKAYNRKAWLLATAPSDRDRNGPEAVTAAKKAVQLGDIANNYDTLAAAFAEAGQFSDAVREQEKAIEMAKKEGRNDIAGFESRLDLYRQNKPFHEEPK